MNIAFDIDGTLLDAKDIPREDILGMLRTFALLPDVDVYIWSGSGIDYAERRQRQLGIQDCTKILPKRYNPQITIAFDDQNVKLAQYNINVGLDE